MAGLESCLQDYLTKKSDYAIIGSSSIIDDYNILSDDTESMRIMTDNIDKLKNLVMDYYKRFHDARLKRYDPDNAIIAMETPRGIVSVVMTPYQGETLLTATYITLKA